MDMGIKAPRGGNVWGIDTIRKILNSEIYSGVVVLQKTYIDDFLRESKSPTVGSARVMLYETIILQLYREKVFKMGLDLRALRLKLLNFK